MSAGAWVGIALLGGVGSVLRLLVSAWLNRDRATTDWPLGTFAINLSGAFVLGILSGIGSDWQAPAVLGLGLIGSYTTFSTWMIEAAGLAEAGRRNRAALYIATSLILGLAAIWAGHLISSSL